MTKLLKGLLAMGVAAALAGAATTTEAADMKAAIPFGFTVNNRALPAGIYDVSVSQGILMVRGARDGAFVLTSRAEATTGAYKLVFEKVGDSYELREAWTGGSGRLVPGSRKEPRRGEVAANVERVEVPLS